MSRNLLFPMLDLCIGIALCIPCQAGMKSITLPEGTKATTLGPGHYKFVLPDRQVVEVVGLNPERGTFSFLAVINESSSRTVTKRSSSRTATNRFSSRKLIWGGTKGRIVNARRVDPKEVAGEKMMRVMLLGAAAFALPFTLTSDEIPPPPIGGMSGSGENPGGQISGEDLASEFGLLNIIDPGSDSGNSALELLCESKNGKWNPETKKCEF